MRGREGFITFGHHQGRIGTIQCRHERLLLGAHDESIHRSAMGLRIHRIMQMVFVMRRMLGFFDDKIPERRSSHAPVQEPGQLQHRITISLSLKSSSIHSPQIAIVTIDACLARIGGRDLTIGGTGENQSMQLLEGRPPSSPPPPTSPASQDGWGRRPCGQNHWAWDRFPPQMHCQRRLTMVLQVRVIRPKNPGCQGHSPVTLRAHRPR